MTKNEKILEQDEKIVEEVKRIIPVAGEIYDVKHNKTNDTVEIHFYDHFCDAYGGFRKYYKYKYENNDIEWLKTKLEGWAKPVRG